jgi:hypothetical protein
MNVAKSMVFRDENAFVDYSDVHPFNCDGETRVLH